MWLAIEAKQIIKQVPAIKLLMSAKNYPNWFSKMQIPNEIIDKIVGLIALILAPNSVQGF